MINHIKGTLTETGPKSLVLEAGGVGYLVKTTSRTLTEVGDNIGGTLKILIRQITRETGTELYGFRCEEDRGLFDLLTGNVSGVGPKSALNILEGMPAEAFKAAVASDDTAAISAIKGVGRKTAERIVLELRDKVKITDLWAGAANGRNSAQAETILAVMALGVSRQAAEKAVSEAAKSHPHADAPALAKEAIKLV